MTQTDDKESAPLADAEEMPSASAEGAEPGDEKKSRWGGKKDKQELEALTKAKDEAEAAKAVLQDRFVRLQADFDNFRKRTVREKAESYRAANEDLMAELLPVVDHFEMALGTVAGSGERLGAASPSKDGDDKSGAALIKGVRMVCDQMTTVLTRFGLKALDATVGQTFDPARHEAIAHMPSETVPENNVIAQTRRGYLLGEKLIRPAQVVVSSGDPAATNGDAAAGVDAGE